MYTEEQLTVTQIITLGFRLFSETIFFLELFVQDEVNKMAYENSQKGQKGVVEAEVSFYAVVLK